MEFPFRLPTSIGAPPGQTGPYIGCLDDKFFRGRISDNLMNVLDTVGKKSAIAQGLKKPVTYGSPCSLLGQRLYLMVDDKKALGFIKVGPKRLYVAAPALYAARGNHTDVKDALKEINPVCVLDFYVHESCQRTGLGRLLFDTMLEGEALSPVQLAYDRPSNKFLPFLRKHFGLSSYTPQNNNFVIFDEYYKQQHAEPRGSRSLSVRRGRNSETPSEIGYGRNCRPGDDMQRLGATPQMGDMQRLGATPQMANQPEFGSGSCMGREMPAGDPYADRFVAEQPPSNMQRPPLMPAPNSFQGSRLGEPAPFMGTGSGTPLGSRSGEPGSRYMEQDGYTPSNSAMNSLGRPPNLASNSRPPLGAAPSMQQQGSLQTPWGSAADMPAHPSRQQGNASGRAASGGQGGVVAGMRSGGNARSVSMPCRGDARTPGDCLPGGCGFTPGSSGGGSRASADRRYASPLSHAGSRMLAL